MYMHFITIYFCPSYNCLHNLQIPVPVFQQSSNAMLVSLCYIFIVPVPYYSCVPVPCYICVAVPCDSCVPLPYYSCVPVPYYSCVPVPYYSCVPVPYYSSCYSVQRTGRCSWCVRCGARTGERCTP